MAVTSRRHLRLGLRAVALAVLSGGVIVASAGSALAAIGEPVQDSSGAIFRGNEWYQGTVGSSQTVISQSCSSTGCFPLFGVYAQSGVNTPVATPKAGEVFYIRAWAGVVSPRPGTDIAALSLSLPEGVSVSPSSSNPVRCFITSTGNPNVPSREAPDCVASPQPASGVNIPIGAFRLANGLPTGSEIVSVFVPVVSSVEMNQGLVSVSTSLLESPSIRPNPLYGDAPLTVQGRATTGSSGGSSTGSATGSTTPANPEFTWLKKGKGVVSWDPVADATAYRARLKVGTKWTGWSRVVENGLSLSKLKPGKSYTLQVRAVTPSGVSPAASWKFKAR